MANEADVHAGFWSCRVLNSGGFSVETLRALVACLAKESDILSSPPGETPRQRRLQVTEWLAASRGRQFGQGRSEWLPWAWLSSDRTPAFMQGSGTGPVDAGMPLLSLHGHFPPVKPWSCPDMTKKSHRGHHT